MHSKKYDLVIIGAGPIGSYMADKLSATGLNVLVIDKKNDTGEKVCCTGIVSKECLDLLNVSNNVKHKAINSIRIVPPTHEAIYLERTNPFAFLLDRPALNRFLENRAMISGADFMLSTQVTNIEKTDGYIRLTGNSQNKNIVVDAPLVIIANGYGSRLITKINMGMITKYTLGVQSEVEIKNQSIDEIYLNHSLAPGGFAWLISTWNGKALAGMLCKNNPLLHQKLFLTNLKAENKISIAKTSFGSEPIPLQTLNRTFDDRLIVVGEAAGQVKPATGGGIYYGILCADIANEVIKESFKHGDFSCKMLAEYQRKWHNILNKELVFDRAFRDVYSLLNNKLIDFSMGIAGRNHIFEPFAHLNEQYFDWHSKIFFQAIRGLMSFHKSK